MKAKRVKVLVCFVVTLSLIMSNSFFAVNPETAKKINAQEKLNSQEIIKDAVKSYIEIYENDFANREQQKGALQKLYSATKTSAPSIKEMDFLIKRDSVILDTANVDLREYNKTITYDYKELAVDGDTANVRVTVDKRWNYSFSPDVESGAIDNYDFKLKLENGKWKICDVGGLVEAATMDDELENVIEESDSMELDAYLDEVREDVKANSKTLKSVSSTNSAWVNSPLKDSNISNSGGPIVYAAATYNASKAVTYANKWAMSRNPNYANFDGVGGDCTNFTSQCLKAGDIPMHMGGDGTMNCWYYTSSGNRSATWTHAQNFRHYMNSSSSKINKSKTTWSDAVNGDLIQLMYNGSTAEHSMIITGIVYSSSGRSDLLICCHTYDRKNVSLLTFGSTPRIYHHIKGSK